MAFKRKRSSMKKTSKRSKGYRRKSSFRRKKVSTVVSLQSPISDRYITRLNYSEVIQLAYTGTPKYYQFNLNNINDPNRTGSGHQPMGHDQVATLYDKYRVTGCWYDILISNTNPAYQGEIVVLLRPDADVTATFEDAMESSYRQYRVIPAEGGGITRIKGHANLSRIFGIPRSTLINDTDYMAGIGGNPSNQAVLTIYCQNQDSATALTLFCRINLVYTVQFFERKMLAAS